MANILVTFSGSCLIVSVILFISIQVTFGVLIGVSYASPLPGYFVGNAINIKNTRIIVNSQPFAINQMPISGQQNFYYVNPFTPIVNASIENIVAGVFTYTFYLSIPVYNSAQSLSNQVIRTIVQYEGSSQMTASMIPPSLEVGASYVIPIACKDATAIVDRLNVLRISNHVASNDMICVKPVLPPAQQIQKEYNYQLTVGMSMYGVGLGLLILLMCCGFIFLLYSLLCC